MSTKQWYTSHHDMSADEVQRAVAWKLVIARTWTDKDFKAKLLATPGEVLREYGIQVPAGIEIEVLQETDAKRYLVLPSKEAEITVMDALAEPDPGF